MPDKHGFDHLPWWGVIEVRCIEEGCDAGGSQAEWPESKRARHAQHHETLRRRQLERDRNGHLREARRLQQMRERENALAYREETG